MPEVARVAGWDDQMEAGTKLVVKFQAGPEHFGKPGSSRMQTGTDWEYAVEKSRAKPRSSIGADNRKPGVSQGVKSQEKQRQTVRVGNRESRSAGYKAQGTREAVDHPATCC